MLREEGVRRLERLSVCYTPVRRRLLEAFRLLATAHMELRGDLELVFKERQADCALELVTVTSLTRRVERTLQPWLALLPDTAAWEMCDDMRRVRREVATLESRRLEETFPPVSMEETREVAERVVGELREALEHFLLESPVSPSAAVVRQWSEWQQKCDRLESFIHFFFVLNLWF